jgi:hypothetical protein
MRPRIAQPRGALLLPAAPYRVWVVAWLLATTGLCAQEQDAGGQEMPVEPGPRPIRIWSREEYGAGPVVFTIAYNAASGFIYLGNGRGVSEYDGVHWRTMDPPDRGPTRGAAVDNTGKIWTGRYNGVFLVAPDAVGELQLVPQTKLLPPDLREIGYVRQIENTPLGVGFTARQTVFVIAPSGALQVWRAEEPFNNTWWMNGALHNSITNRGTYRMELTGTLAKIHGDAPVVLASQAREDGSTLLLTNRGPLRWSEAAKAYEAVAGYEGFFTKDGVITGAAFLRDGRSVFASDAGDLAVFDREGKRVLTWLKVPTLPFNYCRNFTEDDEGGLWLAKHAGVIRIQLDEVPAKAPPLRVSVRRVSTAAGDVVYSSGGGAPPPQPLTLARDLNAFHVDFAAPSYRHERQGGEKLQFRSRLGGLDRDWTPWSDAGAREFKEVPWGTRQLEIEVRRPGEKDSATTTLTMRLVRTWWRTPWAIALFVGSAGAVLLGAHRLGTRALRKQALKLEEIVEARTHELAVRNRELAALRQLDIDEKAAARLAEEKARLEVLRYQLNPHFLYNTLNSLYSLVLTSPPAAADMVLRLADFCRVALERHEEGAATVGTCFDRLAFYLEIEKIRWGQSLQVETMIEPETREAFLPPFLLLPLVENAIKYGGATSPDELRLRLGARLVQSTKHEGRALEIEVANTGQWVEASSVAVRESTGIGLENLRQRLQRYYPGQHEFSTTAADGWVRVVLRIEKWASPLTLVPESKPADPIL